MSSPPRSLMRAAVCCAPAELGGGQRGYPGSAPAPNHSPPSNPNCQEHDPADAPQRAQVSAGVSKPPHGLGGCIWMPPVNGTGNSPVSGTADPPE